MITFEPSRCDYATAHASDVSCAGHPALGGSSRWSARPPAWLTVPGARDIQRHPLVCAERTQSPKSAGLGIPSLALPCTSQCPSPASRGILFTPPHPSVPRPPQGPEDSPHPAPPGGNGERGQRFGAQHVASAGAQARARARAQCAALRRSSVAPSPRRWALAVTS